MNNVVDSIEINGIGKSNNIDEKFIKSKSKNDLGGNPYVTESETFNYLPTSSESLKVLFTHLQDKSFFDVTLVRDKNH